MQGIVLELQEELISKDVDILSALRKAHTIAIKLNLTDFDKWIKQELDGYPNMLKVPSYRRVRGELKAFNPYRGWIPTMLPDSKWEKTLCERGLVEPISYLINLYNTATTGYFKGSFSTENLKLLNELFDAPMEMEYALIISTSFIPNVEEQVKNRLLQWTLDLEQIGIVGEGLSFSNKEKELAKNNHPTINNYYGATNVINAPISNAQINVCEGDNFNFSYIEAENAVKDIEKSITSEQLSDEDREQAIELLKEINEKIEKKKKPGIIRSALAGLREFLISVGASVTASIINGKITGLY